MWDATDHIGTVWQQVGRADRHGIQVPNRSEKLTLCGWLVSVLHRHQSVTWSDRLVRPCGRRRRRPQPRNGRVRCRRFLESVRFFGTCRQGRSSKSVEPEGWWICRFFDRIIFTFTACQLGSESTLLVDFAGNRKYLLSLDFLTISMRFLRRSFRSFRSQFVRLTSWCNHCKPHKRFGSRFATVSMSQLLLLMCERL